MRGLAEVVRFVLELAGIAALAAWGRTLMAGPAGWFAAAMPPAVLIVVWGAWVAPKARSPLSPCARTWTGAALLLLSATALHAAGSTTLAIMFAAAVVLDTAILHATRPRE